MKIHIKKFLLVFLALPLFTSAQREDYSSYGDNKIVTGGSFGLQFGTYTLIDLEPLIGYKVTNRFIPGVSFIYMYEKLTDPSGYLPAFTTSVYGGSVFMRYYFLENVFADAEYEVLNLEVPVEFNNNYTSYQRANTTGVLLGGGYRQSIGGQNSINIILLYDFNGDINWPFSNPLIKVGLGIGF